jgi:hypothetical protein
MVLMKMRIRMLEAGMDPRIKSALLPHRDEDGSELSRVVR